MEYHFQWAGKRKEYSWSLILFNFKYVIKWDQRVPVDNLYSIESVMEGW